MNLISTPFLSYSEINTETTDIYDDAWGFSSEFTDVISYLGEFDENLSNSAAERLILTITRSGT